MKIKEMQEKLNRELPLVKGIVDKRTSKEYLQGENPFMDMQIKNCILCPVGVENWHGFIKSDYELVYH